jgi:hypothetical protein
LHITATKFLCSRERGVSAIEAKPSVKSAFLSAVFAETIVTVMALAAMDTTAVSVMIVVYPIFLHCCLSLSGMYGALPRTH